MVLGATDAAQVVVASKAAVAVLRLAVSVEVPVDMAGPAAVALWGY
jgi:hypothetical protein